ncbi:Gfo/Idh/MocA family oxidoreductase [Agrobacterium tumefaciens]|uniref:Gfo/Idh/MocA family oxidoreductase n=1 Tax=Agrobacterium tumefaciens TaxID=358 RepID=UPI0015737274|nr:Gfo/Idh/MocA family oxidoreductase [Agrobacterium tumefaciens]NTB97267.1 Gfo/Idh/MocA family oxidoreductase [Agrobacterium tumefaciens]NTC45171.1 Gfo/Idh/MocA family oxidoreductase [Agrobacterium tumefaciens]
MRIGLVGYGTGGQHFHAPFIAAAQGVQLAGVVARAPETVERVKADCPTIPVYPSLTAMIDAGGIDAVTITTPPQTRRTLVLQAIEAGLHVVADKPFAPSAEAGRELDLAAKRKGVVLGVFHNRRFDADVLTLRKVLQSDRIGRLWRVHSRMDLDDPHTLEAGPTGGLLRDLGSHLVDQMLWLLGPAKSVTAHWDIVVLPEGATDASFVLTISHASGVHSHLSASKLNRLAVREFRAYGEAGSYVSSGTDVQAQAIFAGKRPVDDLAGWGYEVPDLWGTLRTADGAERIPSEQGRYHDYYEAFAQAVATNGAPPVTGQDAVATLAVLDAARTSAIEGRTVNV